MLCKLDMTLGDASYKVFALHTQGYACIFSKLVPFIAQPLPCSLVAPVYGLRLFLQPCKKINARIEMVNIHRFVYRMGLIEPITSPPIRNIKF